MRWWQVPLRLLRGDVRTVMNKKIFFAIITALVGVGLSQLSGCSDNPTEMPKNDASPGQDVMNVQDNYQPPQDQFVPDSGNACDKGIPYDNTKLPGWPNLPQP